MPLSGHRWKQFAESRYAHEWEALKFLPGPPHPRNKPPQRHYPRPYWRKPHFHTATDHPLLRLGENTSNPHEQRDCAGCCASKSAECIEQASRRIRNSRRRGTVVGRLVRMRPELYPRHDVFAAFLRERFFPAAARHTVSARTSLCGCRCGGLHG